MRHLLLGQSAQHPLLVFSLSIDEDCLDIVESFVLYKAVDFRMFLFVFLKQ